MKIDSRKTENGASGVESESIAIRFGRFSVRWFPVETLLATWPGLETQPRYDAPGDLRVEIVKT